MISGDDKMSTTDMCGLAAIQVWESVVIDTALSWLPHRNCMAEIFIGRKYCVRDLNEMILKYL